MRSSEQEGAEPGAFCRKCVEKQSSEKQTSQHKKNTALKPCEKAAGKKALCTTTSLQKRTKMQNKNPDVQFILEAFVGSLVCDRRGRTVAQGSKCRVSQERYVGSCESNGLTLVKNPSGQIICVLRLNVMFANPCFGNFQFSFVLYRASESLVYIGQREIAARVLRAMHTGLKFMNMRAGGFLWRRADTMDNPCAFWEDWTVPDVVTSVKKQGSFSTRL